ncbi:hypothetical protein FPQ18DRAFT_402166 [Pyronema domesticum]|nr:hypothetical protein FPQ18DRAFT_402166 [Pyronema domesticum]
MNPDIARIKKPRPSPLTLGLDMSPLAPPPTPMVLDLSGLPPTPRKAAMFRDRTQWSPRESENLMLAMQSGIKMSWEEVAELFPGKTAESCREKFSQLENERTNHLQVPSIDSSFGSSGTEEEDMPALSLGPTPMTSPMFEKQPAEAMKYWIVPEARKTPAEREKDIGAWFAGVDVVEIEQNREREYYAFA